MNSRIYLTRCSIFPNNAKLWRFPTIKVMKASRSELQTKFYKSNKERIFLALVPSTPENFENQKLEKTNFEHWKFMESYKNSQCKEIMTKLSTSISNCVKIEDENWHFTLKMAEVSQIVENPLKVINVNQSIVYNRRKNLKKQRFRINNYLIHLNPISKSKDMN